MLRILRSDIAALVLLSGMLAVVGCSSSPPMAQVEGTVRLQGKPLPKVQVEFWPEADGPRSIGATDAQGHYQLATDKQIPGAQVGIHRVIVYDLGVYSDKFTSKGKDKDDIPIRPARFPAHYSDAAKTPLKKEVVAGKNVIDLDITAQ